jgi:hypothetical protein
MALVTSADEAEIVAEEWLKRKYPKRLGRANFSHVMLEGKVWTLRADLEIKGDLFARAKSKVVMKIDSESMNVIGYSDVSEG